MTDACGYLTSNSRGKAVASLSSMESSMEALAALLSKSAARPLTPSRRDVSPVGTELEKRSMLPAQSWALQASAATCESTIFYPVGATVNIPNLSQSLTPLANSKLVDLQRVADIVDQRDHIHMSLVLYKDCDARSDGYLQWKGGDIYNFVVRVFRHFGLLPPFSGQVKEVAEQLGLSKHVMLEMLEARECLCLVDALLQAFTWEARRKNNATAKSSLGKEVIPILENDFARKSDNPIDCNRVGNSYPVLSNFIASQPSGPRTEASPMKLATPVSAHPPQLASNSTVKVAADTRTVYASDLLAKVPSSEERLSLADTSNALDKEIANRDHQIQQMTSTHEANVRHLNEMVRHRDEQIEKLQPMCGMQEFDKIDKHVGMNSRTAEIHHLEGKCLKKADELTHQREFIGSLKEDVESYKKMLDCIREEANSRRNSLISVLESHNIPYPSGNIAG